MYIRYRTIKMEERVNIRDVLHKAFEALNRKDDKIHYFDMYDDSLITHGIPGAFSNNKEGMEKFYSEIWRAFPDAIFSVDDDLIEGNKAAVRFTMTGIQKEKFLGIPSSAKSIKVQGMSLFAFNGSKCVERWELIDMLSMIEQLSPRQQISALMNGILDGLFKRHHKAGQ